VAEGAELERLQMIQTPVVGVGGALGGGVDLLLIGAGAIETGRFFGMVVVIGIEVVYMLLLAFAFILIFPLIVVFPYRFAFFAATPG